MRRARWLRCGSSPRVWGTCRLAFLAFSCASVHPHVCGEHVSSSKSICVSIGSSPRVWGTYLAAASQVRGLRFIPTCVHFNVDMSGVGSERFIPTCVGNMYLIAKAKVYALRFIPTCVGNMPCH